MNCAVIREMLVSVAEPPSDPESCGAGVRVAVSWWAVWSKEGLLGGVILKPKSASESFLSFWKGPQVVAATPPPWWSGRGAWGQPAPVGESWLCPQPSFAEC